MNTFRKLLGLLFAVAFALSSSAVFAGDKQYVLTVASVPLPAPQPAFKFTFLNDGNSSFNSLSLSLPPNWTASGVTSSRGTATINGATVTVNNINLPNGAGQSMTVTVTGVAGVANLCSSAQSGNWTAQPWTGSSVGSGQKFNPKPGSAYPVPTSIPATCYTLTYLAGPNGSITGTSPQTVAIGGNGTAVTAVPAAKYRFVNWSDSSTANPRTDTNVQGNINVTANFAPNKLTVTAPATAYINTAFNVAVAYDGPVPTSIDLAWTCSPAGAGSLNSTATSTSPVNFSVTVTQPGACTFTASNSNYASASAVTTVYTGNLACGGLNNFGGLPVNTEPPLSYFGTPDWGLQSSVTNKDGTDCTDGVPFSVLFDPNAVPAQTASFNIPPATSGKSIKAQYVTLWKPVPIVTSATDPDAGWSTGPYTPRPKLGWVKDVSDSSKYKLVPALWCKDDGLGNASDVLPTIPAVEPFVSLAAAYPGYAPGATAQMCVAQAGSTSVGLSFIQFWHKITDYVDGAVSWGQD